MIGVVSLFAVVLLSLLITRVATVALVLTGMSKQAARFQARSAFTGVGFTTSEAESVVDHPVRRRIVMALMLLGSVGTASVVASLLLSFVGLRGRGTELEQVAVIVGGMALLLAVLHTPSADRWLTGVLQRLLRRFTRLDARDYAGLLHLSGQWMIGEVRIREEDWVANRALREMDLPGEGVLVLGIQRRTGKWIGAPGPETCMRPGDTAVLYGPRDVLADLDDRRRDHTGEQARGDARARFSRTLQEQQRLDRDA
ncbi:cation:proton antiporter regulatory subunit [Streptomyces sp. TRM70350]|uniref:cation:proton antiporter regulatory subunit n=1 Tax=Streptomyces sp. TRM70350 TaxID=2856165 RepID=UPI001C46BC59|nr:TrkA C-terminal domain-containing protein [Streptomyces sp. TRM70350]MBV7694118.1 TrkA C-terminal domain-containing protein [Streptomyces sp. TRM70350]